MSHKYKFDIYVSYAHADNIPPGGVQDGWVDSFVNHLTKNLQRMREHYWENNRIFFDKMYQRDFSEHIEKAIESSKTFVCIVSRKYLTSEWCRKELDIFCERGKLAENNIFVVDTCNYSNIDVDIPELFQSISPYVFWKGEPKQPIRVANPMLNSMEDRNYFESIRMLAYGIFEQIESVKSVIEVGDGDGESNERL